MCCLNLAPACACHCTSAWGTSAAPLRHLCSTSAAPVAVMDKKNPGKRPQTVCRILKGKVARILNHQRLQASRTRATLVGKRRDTRWDSASSLCEDLCGRSYARSPWQVLSIKTVGQDPCERLSAQGSLGDLCKRIFARDLKVRSLFKVSLHDLRARPPLSSPILCTRSPWDVS